MRIVIGQGGEWNVLGSEGQILYSAPTKSGAMQWMDDNPDADKVNEDESKDKEDKERSDPDSYGYDWEDKFNLDLDELMSQYNVPEDMKKYFEGMEYDTQSEGFMKSLMEIEGKQRGIKSGALERGKEASVSGFGQTMEGLMQGGEAASFKMNEASRYRGSQIGGQRGGNFADRFTSQSTAQSIGLQSDVAMSQATQKISTMDDALASLDFEAQSANIKFQEDVYGQRKEFMDDFFSRLLQVEQAKET